jgi:carbonic anhydrase
LNTVKQIKQQSQTITDLKRAGQLQIIGAMYNVATGKMTVLNDTTQARKTA